jgi:hypothetical protein
MLPECTRGKIAIHTTASFNLVLNNLFNQSMVLNDSFNQSIPGLTLRLEPHHRPVKYEDDANRGQNESY